MCFITLLASHTWRMNSSHSKRTERNILRLNRFAVALLIWLKWGGREIILLTARIRFVVSRKDEFLEAFSLLWEKLSWIWAWKQLQWLQRQRAFSETCTCRRRWVPVQPWGGGWTPLPFLPPCIQVALLQWRLKSDRMELNLKKWVFTCSLELVFFCVVSTMLKTSKEGEGFSHLSETVFALSSYGHRS